MKLHTFFIFIASSSLLALTACGTSTIGGDGGGGNGGTGNTGGTGGSDTGLCKGQPSPVSCTANSCPSGYVCVEDADPNTCHPSNCSCDAEGWMCTADCGMNGSTCVPEGTDACGDAAATSKTCTVDTDCAIGVHQINCCGTSVALGIAASQASAFAADEAACAASYPACGCAAQQTKAEDGNSGDIQVKCDAGQCKTYVPAGSALCNGVPSPLDCADIGCPDGWTCTADPDPNTCHPSNCSCDAGGWACTDDCQLGGSTCVQGL